MNSEQLILIICAVVLIALWDWVRKQRNRLLLRHSSKMQFFDVNGNPLARGKVHTYSAGTTTPLATYTDPSCTEFNPNPVILDSDGEASIWSKTPCRLTVIIKKLDWKTLRFVDTTVWTMDNLVSLDLEDQKP